MGLYFSVSCDCNEGFEGAVFSCGLQLRRGLELCYTLIYTTVVSQIDAKVNTQFSHISFTEFGTVTFIGLGMVPIGSS